MSSHVETMSITEMSNWWALCNALKFIDHTARRRGVTVAETDLNYREILCYISAASGDIATCLESIKGVPFKYALCTTIDDAYEVEDLQYTFIGA